MKAKYYKARIWEIEWGEHVIKAELIGTGLFFSSDGVKRVLYVDGKCIDEKSQLPLSSRTLSGFIGEANEKHSINCNFSPRSTWREELQILRQRKILFGRVISFICDEILFSESIEMYIHIDGKAIYHSLFGTQKEIRELGEVLENF